MPLGYGAFRVWGLKRLGFGCLSECSPFKTPNFKPETPVPKLNLQSEGDSVGGEGSVGLV